MASILTLKYFFNILYSVQKIQADKYLFKSYFVYMLIVYLQKLIVFNNQYVRPTSVGTIKDHNFSLYERKYILIIMQNYSAIYNSIFQEIDFFQANTIKVIK